ncbi:MAG: cell division protein FtsA [Alphaproteobacteria bacterium]|nr:cell division protein FtsA [Alphaproteobacteria bacterium]
MARSDLITALDIGSTKICCFIAELGENGRARVIGIAHHASQGIKSGAIVNMEDAQLAVIGAVNAAEQMAGATIRDAYVNVSCGAPENSAINLDTAIGSGTIGDGEMRKLFGEAKFRDESPERTMIHSIPVGYKIDGVNGVRNPRGMTGQTLGVRIRTVSVAANAIRNLDTCVGHCHLDINGHVVSPYASGLACLVEDETDLGVTVIDMGGGTTSFAVFFDGSLAFTDSIPVGGTHVTNDIARGLSTPINHAERLKTLHGSVLASPTDERDIIDAPQIGEEEDGTVNRVPKSFIVSIIAPRLEETFELVRAKLDASGVEKVAGRRVVLTGGASQLTGVRELAGQILDKQVRLGRPIRVSGLAEATCGPAFATGAGLLSYAADNRGEVRPIQASALKASNGPFGRIGGWFREHF